MSGSRQREWLTDILESAPSIIFLVLWRSDVDMEMAGWLGVGLAAIVLIGFRLSRVHFNPILLGINVHLLIITPLIVTVSQMGALDLARALTAASERGVLVTVFIVGCALTAFSRRGFIGTDDLPDSSRWGYSLILLVASAAAIIWAFTYTGNTLLAIAVPMMGLFGLRRLLVARWLDRSIGPIAALQLVPVPHSPLSPPATSIRLYCGRTVGCWQRERMTHRRHLT
ncbi:hypothetical protein [Allomesorhizobium camelthorni]|uniref:Uncharacterized protein n=1 Tax=Allomesorhizobium camelthorni TaxID=475069 RepID=A0A6G4WH15_9HYPH|nr:hypothetical protein [Mesorhizobium camelthorni]NGO54082.1 hypothetical protein [Mesorhizobium camelthorni]